MSPLDVLVGLLLATGAFLLLVSAIGLIRMQDLFMRMQAATKASSLGVVFIVAGVAVHFRELAVVTRALAIIAFVLITTPVAAHLIGRAAYAVGVPLWSNTRLDERSAVDLAELTLDRERGRGPG